MILSITPSASATITVSLEVKSTAFRLGALIFRFLFLFIGFSSREGTRSRSWSTHLASCPVHGLLLFVGVLSKLLGSRSSLRFYIDL